MFTPESTSLNANFLKEKFNEIDTDHDGFISAEELRAAFGGKNATTEDMRSMCQVLYKFRGSFFVSILLACLHLHAWLIVWMMPHTYSPR